MTQVSEKKEAVVEKKLHEKSLWSDAYRDFSQWAIDLDQRKRQDWIAQQEKEKKLLQITDILPCDPIKMSDYSDEMKVDPDLQVCFFYLFLFVVFVLFN
jgi:hypothetical protein